MFNRRVFGKMIAATLAAPTLVSRLAEAQAPAPLATGHPELSVMIWTLKSRGTFEENLQRVADAGYRHVELVGEYKSWSEEENRRILALMQTLHITVDALAGMKSGFADPSGGDAFLADLKELVPVCKKFGCSQIILLSGKRLHPTADQASTEQAASDKTQHATSIENLKRAAEILAPAGIVGVIEPIDRLEQPAIYLDGVTEGFAIVDAVGSPQIKVLYDLYHEQREFGNLMEKLEKNIAKVGLIHIADVPGRHQPGTGEINYQPIYRKLAQLNYRGVIAMEFYPTGDITQTLKQAREEVFQAFDASHGIG